MPCRKATQATARLLRKKLPPAFPVTVRTVKNLREYATCELVGSGSKRRFLIEIAARLNDSEAAESLRHEWAHALAWSHLDDQQEKLTDEEWHTDVWGVCYARVYRACVSEV